MDIAPPQLRAARALVDWSREELALQSKTTARTITRIEAGETVPRLSTLQAIRSALEAAGVEFIPENGGGAGVRLRKETTMTSKNEVEKDGEVIGWYSVKDGVITVTSKKTGQSATTHASGSGANQGLAYMMLQEVWAN